MSGLIDITKADGAIISVNANNCNLSEYADSKGVKTYAVYLDGIGNVSISKADYDKIKDNNANVNIE